MFFSGHYLIHEAPFLKSFQSRFYGDNAGKNEEGSFLAAVTNARKHFTSKPNSDFGV